MKQLEKWCNEYREKWNQKHLWDSYCLTGDAWLAGYKKAREEAEKVVENNFDNLVEDGVTHPAEIRLLGEDDIGSE